MQMPATSRLYHSALNPDAVCDSAEEKRRAKEKRGRPEFSFLSRRATIVFEMLSRERKVNWITAAAELRQLNSKAASASLENGRLPYRVLRRVHLSMSLRERKFGLTIFSNRSMRRD